MSSIICYLLCILYYALASSEPVRPQHYDVCDRYPYNTLETVARYRPALKYCSIKYPRTMTITGKCHHSCATSRFGLTCSSSHTSTVTERTTVTIPSTRTIQPTQTITTFIATTTPKRETDDRQVKRGQESRWKSASAGLAPAAFSTACSCIQTVSGLVHAR